MGKGDKKSRRGKIILGTYGVRRPKKKVVQTPAKPVPLASEPSETKIIRERREKHSEEAKPERDKARPVKEKAEKTENKAEKTDKETKAAKETKPKKDKQG